VDILLVTRSLLSDSGQEAYVRGLAGGLTASGHQVRVHVELGGASRLPEGVTDVTAPELERAVSGTEVVHLHLPVSAALARRLATCSSLVIHPHDYSFTCPSGSLYRPHSSEICARTPGPLCYFWALETGCAPRLPGEFSRTLGEASALSSLLKTGAYWTVPAAAMRERLVERGVTPDRISVTGWAADSPDGGLSPVPGDGPVVYIGPVEEKAGVFDLLDVVLVTGTSLVVAGEGPDLPRFREAIGHSGLEKQVTVMGPPSKAGRDALYRKALFAAVPSRWQEPVSAAGAEAAAHGRAVVGYDHGSWHAWAKDQETALFARRGYVHELSGAARVLVTDRERLTRMSREARMFYERELDWDGHLQRMLPVYETARRSR